MYDYYILDKNDSWETNFNMIIMYISKKNK